MSILTNSMLNGEVIRLDGAIWNASVNNELVRKTQDPIDFFNKIDNYQKKTAQRTNPNRTARTV
jgi:alpha-acetolactate decarboxylase